MPAIRPLNLALLASLLSASVAIAEPIAFLVGMKGTVSVTARGASDAQRAALGRPLERGDRVQVGKGGSATLFFSDGNVIELGEQSSVTVGGKVGTQTAQAGPGADLSAEVFAKVSRFVKGDSKQAGMVALAPMRGGSEEPTALILAPRRTSVRSQRPEFRWREVAGAERYTISVSGDEGEVWRGETAGTAITPPGDAVLLTRGSSYLAELTAYGNQGRLRAEETVFSIMSEAETRQVGDHLDRIEKAAKDSTPGAAEYLTGSYLVGQGLYAEAIPYFESLCRLDPESPGAHEALANAYRAIGLADLAAAEFEKALELTRSPAGTP